MRAEDVRRAAVLGAGTMGHGIAQVLAMGAIETRLYDVDARAAAAGLEKIRANLDKGVEKGKVAPELREASLARLSTTSDLARAVDGVELVVEAVPEKLELKEKLFGELSRRLGGGVLLATNTSSLSGTRIARAAAHPGRVVGMHFFNPVHVMKLVRSCAARIHARAVSTAMGIARRLGKDPIEVRDAPGFASSRLGVAIGLEAMRMLEEGVASAADIDKAMVLGYGFPMGPLELTDLVGLDVRLAIAEYLASELGERFSPPRILRDKVARGELGKKTGLGFHDWTKGRMER